jgi:DNA-binding beta-propeller fold protein YncE
MTGMHSRSSVRLGAWLLALASACDAGVAELDRPITPLAPAARCKRIDPPITAGLDTAFGSIVATRDGKRLYVARGFREDVVEVSTHDLSIRSTIPVGGHPDDLALRQQPETLAVAVNTSPAELVTIDIDPASETYRQATTTVLESSGTGGLAYRPGGAELYVLTQRPGTGFVNVLDASTLTLLAAIPSGAHDAASPFDIAFTADSAKAYVSIFQSDPAHNVAVISPSSRRMKYLNLGLGPPGTGPSEGSTPIEIEIVRSGDTARVWVIAHHDVFVIDPITDSVIRTHRMTTDAELNGLCASPDGSQVVIMGEPPLAIYDGVTGARAHTLRPRIHGYRCTFSVDGCHLYITDHDTGAVHRIDPDDVVLD